MPRKSRRHQLQDEILYHLINRGNRRLKIFHDEDDYQVFRKILIRYKEKRELKIVHYCLMSNHYHLEVDIGNPEELSSIMAGINRSYTAHYHNKYKTSGYLWQGRFQSVAIEREEHAAGCGRYIERNPVKAKMVENAEDYKYSSARYYVKGEEDEVVTMDKEFIDFGESETGRRENYRHYLMENMEEETDLYRGNSQVVGNKDFKNKLMRKDGRWVPARQGNKKGTNTFVN